MPREAEKANEETEYIALATLSGPGLIPIGALLRPDGCGLLEWPETDPNRHPLTITGSPRRKAAAGKLIGLAPVEDDETFPEPADNPKPWHRAGFIPRTTGVTLPYSRALCRSEDEALVGPDYLAIEGLLTHEWEYVDCPDCPEFAPKWLRPGLIKSREPTGPRPRNNPRGGNAE